METWRICCRCGRRRWATEEDVFCFYCGGRLKSHMRRYQPRLRPIKYNGVLRCGNCRCRLEIIDKGRRLRCSNDYCKAVYSLKEVEVVAEVS